MTGDGRIVAAVDLSDPVSILVYSGLDLVGDGLMKLPFLRAVRHAYPQARITWMAGKGRSVYAGSLAELVRPYLDEVIEEAGIGLSWREVLRQPLPGRRFDLVIDTQRRVKTTLILKCLRYGVFISGAADYRLSDRKPPGGTAKKPRMVDAMLDLVAAAVQSPATVDHAVMLDPGMLEMARAALPEGPAYIGLAPGAGGRHKCWPLDRYVALAGSIAAKGQVPVFLLGPDERTWQAGIAAAVPQALFPLLAEQGSPVFTIAVASRLRAAVANDSGTGHMIAAADIPLVSLFGPTDPAKFAPWVTRGAILRAQDVGGTAMDAISTEAVLHTLAGLLSL